jgi:hypothetical protein
MPTGRHRHSGLTLHQFVSFAQSTLFRGAGIADVWPELPQILEAARYSASRYPASSIAPVIVLAF